MSSGQLAGRATAARDPAGSPVILTLSFGPALVSLTSRGRGVRGALVGLLTVLPYTIYSWLIFPVLLRALGRQLIGRSGWTKTPREPITPPT